MIDEKKLIEDLKVAFDALFDDDGNMLYSDHICIIDDAEAVIQLVNSQPKVMDAVQFVKEKKRMCDYYGSSRCGYCKLSYRNNRTHIGCEYYINSYPEEAVADVEKWSAEHPQKTMLQHFKEKHPKAPMGDYGIPKTCPSVLGYESIDYCENMEGDIDPATCCVECWNRPCE